MLGRLQQARSPQQLCQLLSCCSCCSGLQQLQSAVLSQFVSSGVCAKSAARGICSQPPTSDEAATSSAQSEAQEAAHELGLDAVPLGELRGMISSALPDDRVGQDGLMTPLDHARFKRLKYQDIKGYREAMVQLALTPDDYEIPRTPALDAGQWVDAHFKEAGLGFEPRSGFYNWRGWAQTNVSPEQYESLLLTESVMSDDNTRSVMMKQAQHELARLWDWQHRRAALGLTPDLDPAAAAAAASEAAAARKQSAVAEEPKAAAAAAQQQEELATAASSVAAAADDAGAGAKENGVQDRATAAGAAAAVIEGTVLDKQQQQQQDQAFEAGSSSEAFSDVQQQDFSNKGILDLLDATGVLNNSPTKDTLPEKPDGAVNSKDTQGPAAATAGGAGGAAGGAAAAAAPAWITAIEDVADRPKADSNSKPSPNLMAIARSTVERKLHKGEQSVRRNKFNTLEGLKVRQYRPKPHDDDLFLPTKPMGSWQVNRLLRDPEKTVPVNPDKVTRQAVAIVEAAKRAADVTSVIAGTAGTADGTAEWTSMPLLDRTILHEEKFGQQQARLDAKPKRQLPWEILPIDDYTFNLRLRPPTQTLDLLTTYLEVKYADILLRKDAVQTLQRQVALQTLTQNTNGSEALESPPAALTAPKTLSLAEREDITKTLDDLLDRKLYGQYRDAVMQLYCDGLVTWDELQQCWAAAEAGEELAAAENAGGLAEDRDQLFKIISGQQLLGNLSSSSSEVITTAADTAAAKQLWEDAGRKITDTWAAAAARSGSSGSSLATSDKWSDPVRFEEAQRIWQQLLLIAGLPDGPRFDSVLLAGSSSSSSIDPDLQQQLEHLQRALQDITGLDVAAAVQQAAGSSSSSDDVAVDDFDALQQLCVSPPSLQDILQQHWNEVARKELNQTVQWQGPVWQQLWQLLDDLVHKHQQHQRRQQQRGLAATGGSSSSVDSAASVDAAAVFDQYLRETDCAPLTPPPYPGASRILRWEQTIVLGPTSGQTVTPPELKAKLKVSAQELQEEAGISSAALQHILRIAGTRYNPKTGMLSINCEHFPTREENRRWCLEVLHRLLQEGQRRYPSDAFVLGPGSVVSPAAAALA